MGLGGLDRTPREPTTDCPGCGYGMKVSRLADPGQCRTCTRAEELFGDHDPLECVLCQTGSIRATEAARQAMQADG